MPGMAESMIWLIKILQMQHIINKLHKLHRYKCTKMQIVTGVILLKVTKLSKWVALSTAVSVFKKSNKDTMPLRFLQAKYNSRKVETIAKLGPFIKQKVSLSQLILIRLTQMFMVTQIWVQIRMMKVKNDNTKNQAREFLLNPKNKQIHWEIEKIVRTVIKIKFKLLELPVPFLKPSSPHMPIQVKGLVNRYQPVNFCRIKRVVDLMAIESWCRPTGDHLIKWPIDKQRIPEITRCMVEEITTSLLETSLKTLLQWLTRDSQDIWATRETTGYQWQVNRRPLSTEIKPRTNLVARWRRWSSTMTRTRIVILKVTWARQALASTTRE
jgi:hypothetical protein